MTYPVKSMVFLLII